MHFHLRRAGKRHSDHIAARAGRDDVVLIALGDPYAGRSDRLGFLIRIILLGEHRTIRLDRHAELGDAGLVAAGAIGDILRERAAHEAGRDEREREQNGRGAQRNIFLCRHHDTS